MKLEIDRVQIGFTVLALMVGSLGGIGCMVSSALIAFSIVTLVKWMLDF